MPPRNSETGESWYRIVNAVADGPTQIQIHAEIGQWGVSAQDFLRDLAVIDGPVEVHVNSPGGDVFDAYAIYNGLVARPGVTTVVDGIAASAASFIVMAGEQRLMARTSQLMIHDGWAGVAGNAEDLQHMVARLETVSDQIAGIYADTAGGEPDYWRDLMRAETWYTPQQALDAGLITGITGTARVPAAATSAHASTEGTVLAVLNAWDPDGDGDDDSTPEGDIDHSHWAPDGTQLQSVPGKPMPGMPPVEDSARAQAEGLASETEAPTPLEAAAKKYPDYESSQSRSRVPTPGNERNGTMSEDQGALTIEARRSRLGEIVNRFTEIADQFPASVLPSDIQSEWDQLVAERTDHQQALDSVDARNAVLATVHAGRPVAVEGVANTVSGALIHGAPAVHIQRDIYNLAEIRQQASNAEDLPRLYRDNAIRAIDVAAFPGSKREETQERVTALLDTVREDKPGSLALRILATGSPGYKKAFGRALAVGNPGALGQADARILALGESDTGSYAVPFELDPTVLLTSDGAINPLRQISRVVQITSKEYDLVTSTGVTVTRRAEATPTTDGAPTLAQPTIKPERVDGFIPFSVEIEGDWTALQAEMMSLLRDAKDVEEANSFTLGDGTPPAAGGIIGTLDSGSNVAGSGGSGALGAGDPQKLEEALAPRFRTNASFMGSKTTLNAYRTLLIAAGYTYDAYVQATQGTPKQLFGYNAYECSDMPSTHASTDTPLIFGDFKRGFLIVDRVGMNMELVPTLTRQATAGAGVGMPTGQRGYFAWWRNNSRVVIDNAFRLLAVA